MACQRVCVFVLAYVFMCFKRQVFLFVCTPAQYVRMRVRQSDSRA